MHVLFSILGVYSLCHTCVEASILCNSSLLFSFTSLRLHLHLAQETSQPDTITPMIFLKFYNIISVLFHYAFLYVRPLEGFIF